MNNSTKIEFKVGSTVIAAAIVLFMIFGWTKNLSISENDRIYKVRFEEVSGLEKGDNVTINGIKKGIVQDIKIDGNSAIVLLDLEDDVKLKDDARFLLTMLDLMGGKKIEIKPGISQKSLDISMVHQGIFLADIPRVMAMVGSIENQLPVIIGKIDNSLTAINTYLSDEQLRSDVVTSVALLKELLVQTNDLIAQNKSNIKQLTDNSVKLTDDFSEILNENRASVKDVLTSADQTMQKANTLLDSIEKLLSETRENKNNLGKLLSDPDLVSDLKLSIKEVKELLQILNKQIKEDGINVDANINIF